MKATEPLSIKAAVGMCIGCLDLDRRWVAGEARDLERFHGAGDVRERERFRLVGGVRERPLRRREEVLELSCRAGDLEW